MGFVGGSIVERTALREAGLVDRLVAAGGRDAGVVLPGRCVDDDATRAFGHVRNEDAIVEHARRLGDRVGQALDAGETPVVVGGDCSMLVGIGLALATRGRASLVHVDGHTHVRHPGTATSARASAVKFLPPQSGCTGRPSRTSTGSVPPSFRALPFTSVVATTTKMLTRLGDFWVSSPRRLRR
ncbi:arginase family protein [Frondihabitans sucicola]|uniref:arginase family protein n=1 Tax=Frondihabitans sucicola TaxID=1268041 RepID=UPI0033068BEB